jgi:hypothetical protein
MNCEFPRGVIYRVCVDPLIAHVRKAWKSCRRNMFDYVQISMIHSTNGRVDIKTHTVKRALNVATILGLDNEKYGREAAPLIGRFSTEFSGPN